MPQLVRDLGNYRLRTRTSETFTGPFFGIH